MSNIVWLHVESTTRCNAWCPFCPRNNQGFGLAPHVQITDLNLKRLQQVVEDSPSLHTIQFCGNLGDPLAAKNFDKQLECVLNYDKIKNVTVNTNGSLRTKHWWKQLAEKTKHINLEVWFAIDGTEQNHSYYRQGTSYNKIIQNADTFIQSGGRAIWQFIMFAHNKDDVVECYNLSQEMNFADFKVLKNIRSDKKSYHYKTGKELDIKNVGFDNSLETFANDPSVTVFEKNCMHLAYPSMYLSAYGNLHPCCYVYNKPYTPEDIKHTFETKKFYPKCLKHCGTQITTS